MYNVFKNSFLFLLVLAKLCISESERNFTICNLAVVCGLRDGTQVSALPSQCTALAAYSSDMEQVRAMEGIKGDLPLLIVMQNIIINEIADILEEDAMEAVFKDFVEIDFDFMVLDNTYKFFDIDGGHTSSEEKYSQDIVDFLDKTKEFFHGKGVGLVFGHDVESMENKFYLSMMNDHADLFLLESTGYRKCNYHTHQKDMDVLATKDDVFGSLSELRREGVSLDKVIYTIELKIESIKVITSEDMDYSYLCGNRLSDDRKYCYNSIQDLFDKARLRVSEGAAGVYINGIEYDDIEGTCGCVTPCDKDPSYRGLKTIAGASQESENDVNFYDCSAGAFPVIK